MSIFTSGGKIIKDSGECATAVMAAMVPALEAAERVMMMCGDGGLYSDGWR